MTLAELFAANPGTKAEYDAAIAEAFSGGETAATDKMKAIVAKTKGVLTSPDYSDTAKEFAALTIIGDKDLAAFEAILFMEDKDIEAKKASDAKGETDENGETRGQSDVDVQAEADEANMQAMKGALKGEV